TVLGNQTVLLLVSVFGVFRTRRVVQCGFCVGKILITSFSFSFCIASAFILDNSLLIITFALLLAIASSSIITSSHVRPVISPIGIEQDRCDLLRASRKK